MAARLIFVHGTTVRDVSGSMGQIRARSHRILGLGDSDVVAAEWGREVGPPDVDIRPSLPPEYATRGTESDVVSEPSEAEIWELLLADPAAELRILASGREAPGGIVVGRQPPSAAVEQALANLAAPTEQLGAAGFTESEFATARDHVAHDPAGIDALARTTDGDDELVNALARSIVARMLQPAITEALMTPVDPAQERPRDLPAAAVDAVARDALTDALTDSLGASTRGWVGDTFKKVGGPIATRIAVSKRADFMGPLAHFLHDVTYYIAHGEAIRREISEKIEASQDASPVVVLAHSLGGIAAVDLLSDPEAPRVDLLVTVGSQAPLLYLLDSLELLSRTKPDPMKDYRPKVPWLNIYSRDDLLSFCAEQVFKGVGGVTDKAIDAKVPFPAAHSAYWSVDQVYELIKEAMSALPKPK